MLWLSPPLPQPPPPPAAAAAPPPFKLQLLAIIKEDAGAEAGTSGVTYKAMVYDPDSDKVLVVAGGDTLGGRLIESIDRTALKIRDAKGGAPRVLTLKTEGGTR